MKEANEKKMRALRQEYEKIKLSYDQAMSAAARDVGGEKDATSAGRPPRSGTQSIALKTLPKALERIK